MKAAVMYKGEEAPRYVEDFPEPVARKKNEAVISVSAAALKHLDRSRASGRHYSTRDEAHEARVIGGDGVGLLRDGTRVFALGTGMIAERSVIETDRVIHVPAELNDAVAAALPNAVAGSAMALRFRAGMKSGETVLINGATGFTGKIAVQVAKYYGAGKVIATGRNEEALRSLYALGADEIVSLHQDDNELAAGIKKLHRETPIDIIIDYLWGRSAELILSTLMGNGRYTHRTRFISVGAVTGSELHLSAELLRSVNLTITGSGLGSWTEAEMKELFRTIIPDLYQLAAAGKLKADILTMKLKDIERLWDIQIPSGKRLVILPGD